MYVSSECIVNLLHKVSDLAAVCKSTQLNYSRLVEGYLMIITVYHDQYEVYPPLELAPNLSILVNKPDTLDIEVYKLKTPEYFHINVIISKPFYNRKRSGQYQYLILSYRSLNVILFTVLGYVNSHLTNTSSL